MTTSRGPSNRVAGRPLLGAFPLAVMALAAFLVIFTLMMARLSAGRDPVVGTAVAKVLRGTSGNGSVVTRTSRGGAATGGGEAHTEGPRARTPASVSTRTSGQGRTSDD